MKFENEGYITQVDENNRVFGFGTNVQRQRHVVAPPAAAKVYDGSLDENQTQHKAFLSVSPRPHLHPRILITFTGDVNGYGRCMGVYYAGSMAE